MKEGKVSEDHPGTSADIGSRSGKRLVYRDVSWNWNSGGNYTVAPEDVAEWDRRAEEGPCCIGVSCPRCWRPLQEPGYWFDSFCQCGEELDLLEVTLAAHGLSCTGIRFVSSEAIQCG